MPNPGVVTTEVLPGDWDSAIEGLIFTNEIQTCIAASIYSRKDRLGFLGHFKDRSVTEDSGQLTQMIMRAQDSISDISQSEVWVGGGLIIDEDIPAERGQFAHVSNEETKDFRSKVLYLMLSTLVEYGASIKAEFINRPGLLYYTLDVETGEYTSQLSPRYY